MTKLQDICKYINEKILFPQDLKYLVKEINADDNKKRYSAFLYGKLSIFFRILRSPLCKIAYKDDESTAQRVEQNKSEWDGN